MTNECQITHCYLIFLFQLNFLNCLKFHSQSKEYSTLLCGFFIKYFSAHYVFYGLHLSVPYMEKECVRKL